MHASSTHAHLPSPSRGTDLGRLLLGLAVVALGLLFLLDSAGVLDAGRAIDRWWPVAILAAGLFALAERPPAVFRGILLTAIGAGLLLFTTGVVDGNPWEYVWPAAVIVAGLTILAHRSGRAIAAPDARDDELVRATGILAGPRVASTSKRFRGASLTAVFGGVTLDLRHAELAPEGASISATVALGGIEILVPKGWHIDVRATPILGGVEDKTDAAAVPEDGAPTLRIDAVAFLGGVDIKHEKK